MGVRTLAATIFTLLFLAILIVPIVMLANTMVEGVQTLVAHVKDGYAQYPTSACQCRNLAHRRRTSAKALGSGFHGLDRPAPKLASTDQGSCARSSRCFRWLWPHCVAVVLSILVAGVLLAKASGCAEVTRSLANRLFGDRGPEFEDLAGSTIRSVTNGILGVAVIQSFLAGLGFVVAGLPGAGLWTLIFLFAAVLQAGALVLVPAVIYMFAIAGTTKAVLFLLWCIVVALIDNVLKPLLLGRGVAVPIVVVFLGAIGGFIALGIIGLFVGAIVLSVGYKLFLAWLEGPVAAMRDV